MKKTFLLFILCIQPFSASADWFGPNSYEDCILESMKGVSSDRAATAIKQACKSKFPETKSIDLHGAVELTDAEVAKSSSNVSTSGSNPFGDTPVVTSINNDQSSNVLGKVLDAAISAVVLALIAVVIFKLGLYERRKNLQKALINPADYPWWKKEGIRSAKEHLKLIEEHFANSLDRPFSKNELDGLCVYSHALKTVFEQYKDRPIREVLSAARAYVDKP
jgi:hypothetical protein